MSLLSATLRRCALSLLLAGPASLHAQQLTLDTRDPAQKQDPTFDQSIKEWLANSKHSSPLVDHLPLVPGIPTPRDVLGYHVGAPRILTYYDKQLAYYRALEKVTPRVKVETIGRSDEGRELVVVWISSEANMQKVAQNRANLKRIADPRGMTEAQVKTLLAQTKPHYHLMGGLHSGETGPSETLMELAYRLAAETSPIINQIREQLYVSITPAADADGRDRNVDWFLRNLSMSQPTTTAQAPSAAAPNDTTRRAPAAPAAPPAFGGGQVPYWGKYVYHDNNRDINIKLVQMRAIIDWYFTAYPPIMHDLHEAQPLLYTYTGGPPQNPNLDPILFAELPWFGNWEMAQMTKWGMPGVYTHAFMDGWSPGYLGSVAYNHNGLMKMYETQSGRDLDSAAMANARSGMATGAPAAGGGFGGRAGAIPTGRGGAQDREWYRGNPIGFNDIATFTRRSNANYMQTGVISALQLASMFPQTVLENFYIKTRNSIEEGKVKAPYGFVIPVQRDMTRVVEMVNLLRVQRIEIGKATAPVKVGNITYPAGSYVIKRDQPYGRLAKNLLERQQYPDARLNTYDDSGWSMGFAMGVDVVEVGDSSILKTPVTIVDKASLPGTLKGSTGNTIAVAHLGSNSMVTFRYLLRAVPMKVAEQSFAAGDTTYPAGSFVIDAKHAKVIRPLIDSLGLTATYLASAPTVRLHDADVPRVAIYSQWSGTQNLGWYRLTFDEFKIPFTLIYKERVQQGNLRKDFDVILMAEQNLSKTTVMQSPAARAVPYKKDPKYPFLGMYGETENVTGGFGQKGVDAFASFLDQGGTLIAIGESARLPIEFGWARTVDKVTVPGLTAQRPLVEATITRPEHPVFYGFGKTTIPVKYVGGTPFKVGIADEGNVLARYVGGDKAVLSGLMTGADSLRSRPFAVDVPQAMNGRGRVILFANNPIYRWQNHGEFNMVFNSLINWNDAVPVKSPTP
ncbi:M14 family zinc carboxypeptidase [Gemmatimonas sp.]|uniref:M14 family zinc carboxypeptidase n=1 Tax=Gemmatimonas sp. TaxID=1962908 RepID=UPI0033422B96